MIEIKEGENRPSEVFLALWYFRANREPLSAENFRLCAETWWRLRAMEAEQAAKKAKEALDYLLGRPGDQHPEDSGKTEPESGPNRTPEDGGPAEDPAPAEQEPDEDADAEETARKAAETAKARSDAGAKGLITRKKNVLAALEELRDAGVKLQEIADADRRLTLLDVLQMMEHKPVSLPVLAALERAVGVLRARAAGPAEEDMT